MSPAMRILVLLGFLLFGFGASALELPYNKPINDQATLEQKLQGQTAMPDKRIQGFVHIPDQKERVLVQPLGRTWRDIRTRYQPWFDLALVVIAVGAMAAMYFFVGPMTYMRDPEGRKVKRFQWYERFVHWLTAASFIWLALTGLNMVWGRGTLRHLIGDDAFAALSHWAKVSHNSVGFAFIVGLAIMILQWFTENIPTRLDWVWIKTGGGMFGGAHPPARKFNAGQKMIYWIALFGGGAICLTGVALLLPFYGENIRAMQGLQIAHSVIAALMIAVIIGHIYLGSWGVSGSFDAMSTGYVDRSWAHEHHPLWLEEVDRKSGEPPSAASVPAE